MRNLGIGMFSVACLLVPATAVAGGASSGTINSRATATFSDGTSADRLYSVNVGDLDGDGRSDEAWLRVRCADGAIAAAYEVKSPRDSASGMASGKRMHKPFTITKEWGAKSGGAVGKTVSWDIKELKGAKVAASEGKPTYDVKKVEGTGARVAAGGGGSVVGDGKISWEDDWNPAVIRDGSPNLCT